MAERSLSKRAAYYMAAQMGANLVGLATGMVLARVFSKEEMGNFQQLMMVYSLFSGILIMGLPQCLTYFYAISEEEYKPATVYFVTGLLFVLGTVLGVITFLGAPLLSRYFRNDALLVLIRNFFLFYAFTLGGSYIRRLAVVKNRYVFLMFWLPFDRLMMIFSFAVPALLGYGLPTAVRVAVWIAGLKFAIITAYTLHLVPIIGFRWQSGLAARMLFYSVPLGLSAAVSHLSASIDKLVIGRFMSTEFFAIFSLGTMAIPFVTEIAESVMTVLIPVLASLFKENKGAQFVSIWRESVRKTSIFILGIFGFVEFFAVPFMLTLYGAGYVESALYFRIRQFSLIWRVTLFGSVLQAMGQTRRILYVMAVVVCMKPFLSVGAFKLAAALLGPEKAGVGPPVSSLVLNLGMGIYYLFFIRRHLGVTLAQVWPWSYYLRTVAAAVLSGLVASLVLLVPTQTVAAAVGLFSMALSQKPSIIGLVQLLMGAAVFAPAYLAMLKAFRTVKSKDWALLREMTVGRFKRK